MFSIATIIMFERVWIKCKCFIVGLTPSFSSSISPINTNAIGTLLFITGIILSKTLRIGFGDTVIKDISLWFIRSFSTSIRFNISSEHPELRITSQDLSNLKIRILPMLRSLRRICSYLFNNSSVERFSLIAFVIVSKVFNLNVESFNLLIEAFPNISSIY